MALLAAVALVPATDAHAAPPAQLTASAGFGSSPGTVALRGSGFAGGESVDLAVGTTVIGSARAASDGSFPSTTVTVPATTQPGSIRLTAAGRSSAVTAQVGYVVKSGWVQPGFDTGYTRWNPFEPTLSVATVGALTQKWKIDSDLDYGGGMLVANGILSGTLIGGGNITLSSTTGQMIHSGGPFTSPLPVMAGPVEVYTWSDGIHAGDAASGGQPQWVRHFPEGSTTGLSSSGGWLYLAVRGVGVSRLDPRTGAASWTAGTDTDGSAPIIAGSTVLYVGAAPRTVRALATDTGRSLWSAALPGTGAITFLGSGPEGIHYRVGDEVVTLNPATGSVTSRWTIPAGTTLRQYAAGRVIATTGSEATGAYAVLALNPATGAVQWRTALSAPAQVTAAGGQVLYIGQREDHPEYFWGFRALDLSSGTVLKSVALPKEPAPTFDDHEIENIAVADGGVYLQTMLVTPQGKADDGTRTYKFSLPYVAPSLLVLDDPALSYGPGWKVGRNVGDFGGTDHYTESASSTATYTFTGTGFRYWYSRAAHHGVAAVSVDGGPEVRIDQYAAVRADGQISWTSPRLASGSHTVRIRSTGDKSAASTGRVVTIDRLEVGRN